MPSGGSSLELSVVAGGERNAQGAGVWKRVRLKLEGKDPDAGRRANHHEQVFVRRFHPPGGSLTAIANIHRMCTVTLNYNQVTKINSNIYYPNPLDA